MVYFSDVIPINPIYLSIWEEIIDMLLHMYMENHHKKCGMRTKRNQRKSFYAIFHPVSRGTQSRGLLIWVILGT